MTTPDLKALYWPPISALWQHLFSLRNSAAAAAAASAEHEQLLQRYSRWLAQGLRGWRPPSAESGKALEAAAGGTLDFGTEKVPVSAKLLPAARTLSAQLVSSCLRFTPLLDNVLARVLLARHTAGFDVELTGLVPHHLKDACMSWHFAGPC
jgi:hypothetical protein